MVYFWLLFSKVNVVSFNTEASTDGGSDVTSCFSERLALAVPENKRRLEDYIDGPKFIAQRKSNGYKFFSLLSCFTPASSLACVAVVFQFLSGQSGQARMTCEAKRSKKEEDGGGGGERKETVSFPSGPLPLPLPLLFSSCVLLRLPL